MLYRFKLALIVVVLSMADLHAQSEWPQFLGPHRNGHSDEKGLIDGWPADGPNETWRVPGGVGMSGLAISRDRMLTMIQSDGKQQVICLDTKTGTRLWATPVAPTYRNGQGNGPRATPTIAGDRVFVYTGEGILAALDFNNGEIVWAKNVVADHGGKPADYGMASSPLLVGENVVVVAGAPKATLVAYNEKTGEVAWTTRYVMDAKPSSAGYSSPVLLDVGGRKQIVAFVANAVVGMLPTNGKQLWSHPYQTDYDCNIALPVAVDGKLFVSAGENHGCALLKLADDGDSMTVSEVWSSQGRRSVLRNEWQTSVLIDGYLYGFDNVGSAGPVTHLTCVNANTGERVWQKLRFGKGNIITADGKLIITTMNGEVVLVKATPDSFQELGRAKVIGSTRQAPSLAKGKLYLRDDKEIVCISLQKE